MCNCGSTQRWQVMLPDGTRGEPTTMTAANLAASKIRGATVVRAAPQPAQPVTV